jgi:hypothetical protein
LPIPGRDFRSRAHYRHASAALASARRRRYQRLGETGNRRADFRFLAATNRPESAIKHDLLARLVFRIELPGLNDRKEDIPLLVRELLRRLAGEDKTIAQRSFEQTALGAFPRMSLEFTHALLDHAYTVHMRELMRLLWESISSSQGQDLGLPKSLRPELIFSRTISLPAAVLHTPALAPETAETAPDAWSVRGAAEGKSRPRRPSPPTRPKRASIVTTECWSKLGARWGSKVATCSRASSNNIGSRCAASPGKAAPDARNPGDAVAGGLCAQGTKHPAGSVVLRSATYRLLPTPAQAGVFRGVKSPGKITQSPPQMPGRPPRQIPPPCDSPGQIERTLSRKPGTVARSK